MKRKVIVANLQLVAGVARAKQKTIQHISGGIHAGFKGQQNSLLRPQHI
jgi:hypothetical protein